jgi:hypothetical protein
MGGMGQLLTPTRSHCTSCLFGDLTAIFPCHPSHQTEPPTSLWRGREPEAKVEAAGAPGIDFKLGSH